MSLYWCKRCENQTEEGYINAVCLRCKWEYVGQAAFDRKPDYFKDNGNVEYETPEEYFGGLEGVVGVEII